MKIKFLAILGIFLLLFTSCGQKPEQPDQTGNAQTQDTGDAAQNTDGQTAPEEAVNPYKTPDKMNDTRYAGTLDKIGDGYIDVTSDGEQNRFQMGERTLRDIQSLGITEGSRIIVEFETTDGVKTVTQIEKLISE